MFIFKALTLSIFAILIAGCASTLYLRPIPAADQSSVYERGNPVLVSVKRNVVAVQPQAVAYRSRERPEFVVIVFNGTDAPFDFSIENLRVSVDGADVKVMSYEELVAEVESRRRWAAVGAALAGAASSYGASQAAGYQYNYGTTQTNVYSANQGFVGSASGTYSGYTYNPGAAAQAQAAADAQTRQNMEMIDTNAKQALGAIGQTVLRRQTVPPGQWFGGVAKIDGVPPPKPENTIRISIQLTNEVHEFTFANTQAR